MAIKLKKPAVDTLFEYAPQRDGVIVFDFSTTDVTLSQNGNNLVLNFDDGGQIILSGFYSTYTEENMPLFDIKGTIIDGKTFFTALGADNIMPAASPVPSTPVNGGAFFFPPGVGSDLINGLNALGGLTLAQTAASGNLFIPFDGAKGESNSTKVSAQEEGEEQISVVDMPEKNMVVKVEISTDSNNDGYINKNELDENDKIKVTVTLGGEVEKGDEITVTDQNGEEIFRGSITEEMLEGGFDIYIEHQIEDADVEITATVTDKTGNSGTSKDSAHIDTVPGEEGTPDSNEDGAPIGITVDITTDGTDNFINKEELEANGGIKANVSVGNGAKNGDKIVVTLTDSEGNEYSQELIVGVDVNAGGSYDILFEAEDGKTFPEGGISVDATITDDAGNKGSATDNTSIKTEPDTTAPRLQDVLDVALKESHLTGGTEEQPQGTGYKQFFTIEADGDLASITIAGQVIALSGFSGTISLDGYNISNVSIVPDDNGNYTVEFTITLSHNIKHENLDDTDNLDEVQSLPSFEISATDSAGNTSDSVSVDVIVLDDVVHLDSVVNAEGDFSDPFDLSVDFSRDVVIGYVDASGNFVAFGSRTVNYTDVDIFNASSAVVEDGIIVSRTSGKLEVGGADGVQVTMTISADVKGTTNFMQIDGELVNITSFTNEIGEIIYLIGKISDANGDGKANGKDPEDYAQEDLYARVVFDPNTNTWSMEQYKEYSETIVLEFSAVDKDGDSTSYQVGVTGTSDGFEPRLVSELSESVSQLSDISTNTESLPLGATEEATEEKSHANSDIDNGDDIILLDSLNADSVVTVDGGDRGVDLLLIGENNLSSLKAVLENEGSSLKNMEIIMLGDDIDAAKEVQSLLINDSGYFSELNNGWTQGEMHEIGDQNYQEFSNGESTVFVFTPVDFSSMASMRMVNSYNNESMFDIMDDDTASTLENYTPKDGMELSHFDDSGYGVSRNGVFDLSITLTDIATGESDVSDLTSTLEQKGIIFNAIDNSFSLDSEAWSERESGLFINNEEGAIIDLNLLDIQFSNMNT